jgi:predicted nucleic acid-binding protein
MKTLFDTSVIVSGIVESHPMHAKCLTWLQRAKAGGFDCFVASHSLAETFAVLTSLPVKPRISPLVAQKLIEANLQAIAKIDDFVKSRLSGRHSKKRQMQGARILRNEA